LGTCDAGLLHLDVPALGIARAGDELAEASLLARELRAAARTIFFEEDLRLRLALPLAVHRDLPRVLALRVPRAREELPEPAALQDHRPPALLARLGLLLDRVFLGGGRARPRSLGGRGNRRAVLGDRPALPVRLPRVLAIGVSRAGEELSEATPLEDHRLAA